MRSKCQNSKNRTGKVGLNTYRRPATDPRLEIATEELVYSLRETESQFCLRLSDGQERV